MKRILCIASVVVVLIFISFSTNAADQLVEGNITAINGDIIHVQLPDNAEMPQVGAAVEVYFDAGGVRVKVGTWRVETSEHGVLTAKADQIEGAAGVNMIAVVAIDRKKAQQVDRPVVAPGNSTEIVFWNSVRDTRDPAELEAYLEAYPSGIFLTLAKIRLKKLQSVPSTLPLSLPLPGRPKRSLNR